MASNHHAFVGGYAGKCIYFLPSNDVQTQVRCGLPADDPIHAPQIESAKLINGLFPPPPGTPRRAVPWQQLPMPSKALGLMLGLGAGAVFLAACVALAHWLLVAGGVL